MRIVLKTEGIIYRKKGIERRSLAWIGPFVSAARFIEAPRRGSTIGAHVSVSVPALSIRARARAPTASAGAREVQRQRAVRLARAREEKDARLEAAVIDAVQARELPPHLLPLQRLHRHSTALHPKSDIRH